MKLNELAAQRPSKQIAKVFESYFGNKIKFDKLTRGQTRQMLTRVTGLVNEHRSTPAFHVSERNQAYLSLVIMEQGLTQRLRDLEAAQYARRERQLHESEVQQAQVVLAAQDMVDSVQGMLEDVSEMQFKELPALVDSIRNQVGTAQADQFNTDANAALQTMLQSLQGAKSQLEQALSVVTGQAEGGGIPAMPGADGELPPPGAGDELGGDMGGEIPPPEGDVDLDIDADIEEPTVGAGLGRKRR
jgi:hypothetical protein